MNEPGISEEEKGGGQSSLQGVLKFGCLSVMAIFLFFILIIAGGGGLIEAGGALLFGWIAFLERTLPQISWNWDIVGMGLLCAGLILFLAHRFLSWFAGSIAAARGISWRWPWKWTGCGLAAVMIFFLVGMAVGGMTHQIGWIASSPEPWFEVLGKSMRDRMEMDQIDWNFHNFMEKGDNNQEAIRCDIRGLDMKIHDQPNNKPAWMEEYEMLFMMHGTNEVTGLIVFPRDPRKRLHSGAVCSWGGGNRFLQPDEIEGFIRTNRQNLVSF